MKQKQKRTALVALITLISVLFFGCGVQKPDETVGAFLEALKDAEFEEAASYIDTAGHMNDTRVDPFGGLSEDPFAGQIISAIMDTLDYKDVEVVSEDGDKARVRVTLVTPDSAAIISGILRDGVDVVSDALDADASEAEINEMIHDMMVDAFRDTENKTKEKNVTINLVKKDDGWKIVGNDLLLDALTGGLFSQMSMMMEEEEQ